MITTKTPIRISLGAGGIDLPAYYRRFGARFATAAGSKYVYVMVNRHPEKVVWMGLNNAERVDSPEQLNHRVLRSVLPWMGLTKNIEIVSISDVQPSSGVGTSSCFIVGLLKALHAYKGEYPWPQEIAEEACHVEHVLLGEAGGKQDQYAAAYGGIMWMDISRRGQVVADRLNFGCDFIDQLNDHLAFFYTGMQRDSSGIQGANETAIRSNNGHTVEKMRKIQRLAIEIKRALERGDIGEFGELMGSHWRVKRELSSLVSCARLDRVYNAALRSGAVGGNLMGAGGGGHFVFVCRSPGAKERLSRALAKEGLTRVEMRLELQGSMLMDMS